MERPNSAFTFDVLNTFQLLNLQGKLSAHDFYQALVHKTDNLGISRRADDGALNTGLRVSSSLHWFRADLMNFMYDRYEHLLPAVRIWRHLKMLKRSGRGQDPLGIESTMDGECAVECPACPHPGKNLPVDWQSAAEGVRYIF